MAGRYFITGVQLGIIRAFTTDSIRSERLDILELLDQIEEIQFIGEYTKHTDSITILSEYESKVIKDLRSF